MHSAGSRENSTFAGEALSQRGESDENFASVRHADALFPALVAAFRAALVIRCGKLHDVALSILVTLVHLRQENAEGMKLVITFAHSVDLLRRSLGWFSSAPTFRQLLRMGNGRLVARLRFAGRAAFFDFLDALDNGPPRGIESWDYLRGGVRWSL